MTDTALLTEVVAETEILTDAAAVKLNEGEIVLDTLFDTDAGTDTLGVKLGLLLSLIVAELVGETELAPLGDTAFDTDFVGDTAAD